MSLPFLTDELFKFFKSKATASSSLKKNRSKASDAEKIELIAQKFEEILTILDLDSTHSSIKDTPQRIAKMYIQEIFSGLKEETFPKLSFSDFTEVTNASTMVLVKNIRLHSFCEHHFLPMTGVAHIAYIPTKQVIGLSKLNRIAQYFSKRPQLQERLTSQVAEALSLILGTEDIAVYTQMKHFCVAMRGVSDDSSETDVPVLKGKFKDELKSEFYSQIL